MKKWFKENLVLASGILLPVLLVGAFFILNSVPRLLADPPKYDFVMVAYSYDYESPSNYMLSFEVRDGKLSGKAAPRKQNNTGYRQKANLLRYKAATNTFEELVYELPDGMEDIDESIPLILRESDHLQLDKRKQSPDGYSLEFVGNRGGRGLLGELFGTRGRYESGYILKKGNATFELPSPTSNTNYYRNDLGFVGWVTAEDGEE